MKKPSLLFISLTLIGVGIVGLIMMQSFPLGRSLEPDSQFSSPGEQIYFTSLGKDGRISFRGGPTWLRMRGGSCASCHGTDGRGGLPIMMSDEEAPDITYDALVEEEHGDHEEEEHPPFNERLIKRAITEGLEPDGKPLDLVMPRWDMIDEDLDDLIDFLKTL